MVADSTLEQYAKFLRLRDSNPAFCWGVIANLPDVDTERAASLMGVPVPEAAHQLHEARQRRVPGQQSGFALHVHQKRNKR